MRVLVTRPKEDAESIAAELRARGHEPILSPLMEIRFVHGPEISLARFQAVLATSANGIRALARRTSDRDVPVFAVGPQTAAAAREAGFAEVSDAAGDAKTLAEAVLQWADPRKGPLLRVAGKERAGRLAEALTAGGFSVRIAAIYEAVGSGGFSAEARHALETGKVDAVVLFSPRSARLFTEHIQMAGLGEKIRSLVALCISAAAAAPVRSLPLKAVLAARTPDQAAVLALLDETADGP